MTGKKQVADAVDAVRNQSRLIGRTFLGGVDLSGVRPQQRLHLSRDVRLYLCSSLPPMMPLSEAVTIDLRA